MQDLKNLRPVVWPIFLLVLTLMVMHLIEFPQLSNIAQRLQNSLHAPVFGVFAVLVMFSLRKLVTPARAYIMAAAIVVMVSVVGEAIQILGPRDADLRDLASDMVGMTGFLAVVAAFDDELRKQSARVSRLWLIIVAAPLLYASIQPTIWYAYTIAAREKAIPELLGFEHKWESELFRQTPRTALTLIPAPDGWPAGSGTVAMLHLGETRYPGILIQPASNWLGYQYLSFLAASADGQSHEVTLRIHDAEHDNNYSDRFNYQFLAGPQPTRISILLDDVRSAPANRQMDISAIAEIGLFVVDATGNEKLIVDDFRLETD